ncbi:hypothetical protein [Burkholderia pseudomallei]|uniref:hypothetical protein n=1 Tax=Burkholderia pseudomallei TaxID=28450 RepID=UPI0011874531|nr:hypothetical protein [Burkholderia pseudomallei]MBF3420850.1 hypothetical protein [Burkholderia pseudomallei]
MLDLQLGELAHGVPQNQNRGKTILGYTDGHMQMPALGGFPRLSPDAKIPQRLIQRAFSGFQGMTTEIGMARPAGIEPATPAFGGRRPSIWLLVRPSKIKDLPYPELLHVTAIYCSECSKIAAGGY